MGLFKRDPDGPPAYDGPSGYGDDKKESSLSSGFGGPMYQTGPSQPLYACLHLSREDRIRLLGFPAHIAEVVKNTLAVAWPVGIQHSEGGQGWHEFKLRGNPCRPQTGALTPGFAQGREAVPSKRLMIHLLHALGNAGWHLAASTDLSKQSWDKDTLMFRAGPPAHRIIFAVTFNERDKIRIIDPPNESIQQAFIQTVTVGPLHLPSTPHPAR